MLWLPFLGNLILSVGIVGGLIGKESRRALCECSGIPETRPIT
jgi:hypothetical protein